MGLVPPAIVDARLFLLIAAEGGNGLNMNGEATWESYHSKVILRTQMD